ncbi:hypothetical protein WJX81_002312 [Elliptochloris bilobata]|uniref:glycerol-1-phosphatase n=1 Tax=Elliptochloris bilobata TaxID=381761 RepID=A0AAW1RAZ0_9CHLO
MAAGKACTAVIFDMDGLLLNTEVFYTIVQEQCLRRFGISFTFELKKKMMGKKALDAAKVLIEETGLQSRLTPEEFLQEREAKLDLLFPTAELMPGAERLLWHLHTHSVPFALATSSHERHYAVKTQRHIELFSLFSHRVTGDQVARGKPEPDIFLAAAAGFSPPVPADRCLVFEDAPTGVVAAKAAGMSVVMVPDPQLDAAEAAQADDVLGSLEDFQPERWGLPPFPA